MTDSPQTRPLLSHPSPSPSPLNHPSSQGQPITPFPSLSLNSARQRWLDLRPMLIQGTGIALLVAFLYLSINSTLNRPEPLPVQKSPIEKAIARIFERNLHSSIVWDRLAEMTDLYGPRPTGSASLEKSIDWMLTYMRNDDLNVTTEDVTVNYWRRNEESLYLYLPTRAGIKLPMLGLGGSVGTPDGGITAEVVVARNWKELDELAKQNLVKGKIVLFNPEWTGYGIVEYRSRGAQEAEKYGAVAVLVRSITPFSLSTPHTGMTGPAKIPSAAITVEDAELLSRTYHRFRGRLNSTSPFKEYFGPPTVRLEMKPIMERGLKSRNIIIDLPGSSKPEEIVLISGHIDSWDVGTGAVDDGSGFFVAWHALRTIAKDLKKRPKRTIRVVGFTDEEKGGTGSDAYFERHKAEIERHVFAMEADSGTFNPWGLMVQEASNSAATLTTLGRKYLGEYGSGNVTLVAKDEVGADIDPLCKEGVPCAGFISNDLISKKSPEIGNDGYFYVHHTAADTMDKLNPYDLARCSASMASWAYLVAEMESSLPRDRKG